MSAMQLADYLLFKADFQFYLLPKRRHPIPLLCDSTHKLEYTADQILWARHDSHHNQFSEFLLLLFKIVTTHESVWGGVEAELQLCYTSMAFEWISRAASLILGACNPSTPARD